MDLERVATFVSGTLAVASLGISYFEFGKGFSMASRAKRLQALVLFAWIVFHQCGSGSTISSSGSLPRQRRGFALMNSSMGKIRPPRFGSRLLPHCLVYISERTSSRG